jgi:hypothetical protein
VVSGNIAFGVGDKDMIAEPGTLVHLPAGTMHWFRFGQGGGEMISMTSREAASHFFTDVHRASHSLGCRRIVGRAAHACEVHGLRTPWGDVAAPVMG